MPGSMIEPAGFNSIPETIQAFRDGQFIVVMDDPRRENEGDLIVAAEDVSTEQMAFMIRHTSGIICAPLLPARANRLALPPMVAHNEDPRGTAYTLTVDAADAAVTTGISAHDRALTCRRLAQDDAELAAVVAAEAQAAAATAAPPPPPPSAAAVPANGSRNGSGSATAATAAVAAAAFRRPGHVLPLRARPGGVRERRGHTEAGVDFCRLAGKRRVAVISELVDDGEPVPGEARHRNSGMLRGDGCVAFAQKWGLKVCTISDLVAYLDKTQPNGASAFPGPTEDEEPAVAAAS
ncbi:dihydroxy-2-butanone 4-phosphate synthase [Niveomyces insectorum RCEF 264]|uniref:3,4-dihydroxy-2-butanone 4-phosphate synthase n=1 Tax=Niveomyces insectorum RCEF 264 TaxID=1081102 RepID=A0A167TXX8_9HYPO|nr:dihydroxy-2-butanone 4-phosphate synthase [Niveomyces insectorum RCEF 264]